jgi:beta-lactamase regulating signal transducer with metallopeptidase domain
MTLYRFAIENTLMFALLFAGIWLVKRLLHKRLSPVMHYMIWAVVVLKLLVPVTLPSEVSPWNLLPVQTTVQDIQFAHASSGAQPRLLSNIGSLSTAGGKDTGVDYSSQTTAGVAQSPSAQSSTKQAKGLGIDDLILLLWLCGAAATGVTLWFRYRKLGLIVRSNGAEDAPPTVQKELAKMRLRLGIRTPVRAVLQTNLPVPAVMGFVKPVIVLPKGIETDRINLQNALLHELSHVKRGDLLALRLMNMLSVVYWFNPLVWFCFKLIRSDMETACDSAALKLLGEDRRIDYIKTVLLFAGPGQMPLTHAAMSINDGSMVMKKRIERMYLRSKTGIKAKATAVLLALLIASAGFTTACQPNPTTPPVVGKGDLQNNITAAPTGNNQPEAGQHVQLSAQQGKLSVNIDAKLEAPGTDKMPVEMVIPHGFSQNQADNFIKVLFQGKPAYGIKDYLTKSELTKMIIELKSQLSKMKKSDKDYAAMESSIQDYESQVASAPDKYSEQPDSGKFKTNKGGQGQSINLTATVRKGITASINIMVSQSGKSCSLWFTNKKENDSYLNQEYQLAGQPKGVKMSLEDAKALAEKTVKDLGSDLKLAQCSLAMSHNSSETGNGESTGKQAYMFMFTREVNGVLTTYEQDPGGNISQDEADKINSGSADYAETHAYERIVMAVDDSGILELQWSSPDEPKQTVSDNAKILTLDQAVETFKQQFFIHNALVNSKDYGASEPGKMSMADAGKNLRAQGIYSKNFIGDDKDITACTYTIDRVVLGLSRVAVKDNPNEFMIVPVYDFFGSVKVDYTKKSGYPEFISTDANVSFLTINAIDGSIIDRSLGY